MNLEIDLHGLTHQKALNKVEDILLVSEVYKYRNISIITGKSPKLQDLIINELLTKYNFDYYIPPHNQGVIHVSDSELFI